MKPKIYVALKVSDEVKDFLDQYCDVKVWDDEETIPRSILLKEISDCEGVMLAYHMVNEEFLVQAPKLKVVSNATVGYNNFDISQMKKRKVLGTHTPGAVDDSTADLVLALILAAARKIPLLDRYVKEGQWIKEFSDDFYGTDVHHTTIGIIGMGRIGMAIAKRAKFGFDMKVLYNNRSRNIEVEKSLGAEYRSLEELLINSDFVVLMTPLTEETRGLMGEDQFKLMKKSSIFINASRGETMDQTALTKALREGWILGAGLDVFDQEPVDPRDPLLQIPSVVTVPHIGTATRKTCFDIAMLAAQNLAEVLQGKKPQYVVKELQE